MEPVSQTAAYRPGAGGLRVLRYAAWYRATGADGIDGAHAGAGEREHATATGSAGTSW